MDNLIINIYHNDELFLHDLKNRQENVDINLSSKQFNFKHSINKEFSSSSLSIKDKTNMSIETWESISYGFSEIKNLIDYYDGKTFDFINSFDKKYTAGRFLNFSSSNVYIEIIDEIIDENIIMRFSEIRYALGDFNFFSNKEYFKLPPDREDLFEYTNFLQYLDYVYEKTNYLFLFNMSEQEKILKKNIKSDEIINFIMRLFKYCKYEFFNDNYLEIDNNHALSFVFNFNEEDNNIFSNSMINFKLPNI